MKNLNEAILSFKHSFAQALQEATNEQALESVRITFLGRNGSLTELMSAMKELSLEEKKVFGPLLNTLKKESEELFAMRKEHLSLEQSNSALLKKQYFDVTAYKKPALKGGLHLYTHLLENIEDIFISMGYQIVDGPEVETGHYNFEALNIPENHPARDMQDTFWLTLPGHLLRTHTSPVQIRAMENQQPPLAIIAPGRVFRNEATDASHDFMFTQVECLVIDKQASLANLLATAQVFLQKLFGKDDLKIRVRPGYFPFVEPGLEIDAQCPFCKDGCSVCKKTTWIELLGSGLVHPNVLKSCGIDPEDYSGFAFGIGIERVAMLKYGINDIRLFHSGSLHFLQQF